MIKPNRREFMHASMASVLSDTLANSAPTPGTEN
jgi:hypothetical protein